MHYFFIEDEVLTENREVSLLADDLNHAYRVLRLKKGARVAVADGKGTAMAGSIIFAAADKIIVGLDERLNPAESSLHITLCQSMVKGDKFDLIIRQATELGVKSIIPLITERSVKTPKNIQEEKKMARRKAVIRGAAAQCRRSSLPVIEKTRSLDSLCRDISGLPIIVPWEEEKSSSLYKMLQQPCEDARAVFLVVGPEGGFSCLEIETLIEAGAKLVSLGPRILRSETAAVTIISLLQAAWGDLSGKGNHV